MDDCLDIEKQNFHASNHPKQMKEGHSQTTIPITFLNKSNLYRRSLLK